MMLLPEILVVCLIIFLYSLFVFGKEDFILLRKNITLEQLFNIAIIGFLVALFFARVVYVAEHFSNVFFHPLVFFLFPYFPGLSLAGAILGGVFFLFLRSFRKKIPFARILDIFFLSFLFSFFPGSILFALTEFFFTKQIKLFIIAHGFFILLAIFFFTWAFIKNMFKDGGVGFLGFAVFCLSQALLYVSYTKKMAPFILPEGIIFIFSSVVFFAFFLKEEKFSLLGKRRK